MKTKFSRLPICFVSSLSLLLTAAVNAQPSAKVTNLFANADAEKNSVAIKLRADSDILKRRVVRVNLQNLAQQTRIGGKIQINLFENLSFEGIVEKVEDRAKKNYTLSGHLDGDDASNFALSVNEDVCVMNVRTKNGDFYQVRYLENGLHEVRQMNESKFPECGLKAEHVIAAQPNAKVAADQPQADVGDIIDVMVVYTPAARAAAGGTAAIQALISLAVSESNTAYQQSLITPRIRLVYQQEVSYTESGDFDTDLSRVTNPSDGYMDEVNGLRNTYGADLVSLWINNSQYCGLAYLMSSLSPSFESQGFSTVYWDCATGYYSFAHEMGHNMGCAHDRENSGGPGLYSYSYGWRFNGTNGIQYRTIMGYAPGTRIQRFSNPNVSYLGTPTGVAIGQANESHNAQTINNTAFTIANFRQTVSSNLPPSILSQPQPQNVPLGGTAAFSVTASGSPPLYYFWKKAGVNIPGATASSYSITNVQNSDTNNYSVLVSNYVNTVTSSNAALTILLSIPLGEALDATGYTWTSGGTTPWSGQNATTHDGTDAAQSGVITHSQQTWFETTFTGPGTLTYWCKVSSEAGFDLLRFYANGVPQSTNSGEVDWIQKTVNLSAGSQVCRWTYSKDLSDTSGQDKAWVDQISFVPTGGVISLASALDNSGFNWVTGGNGSWIGQSTTSHDSIDAAQSGTILDNQYSILQTTVTGPGTLTFWWKVSSEFNYDWLDFFVDATPYDPGLSGEVNWTSRTFSIPAGTHGLYWQYSKDEITSGGQDKAWVDQIVYSGASSFVAGSAGATNGQFQFQFSGLPGASYTLQASTNLTSWTPLTNIVSSNTINLFLDTGATNFKNRFYKIVSP